MRPTGRAKEIQEINVVSDKKQRILSLLWRSKSRTITLHGVFLIVMDVKDAKPMSPISAAQCMSLHLVVVLLICIPSSGTYAVYDTVACAFSFEQAGSGNTSASKETRTNPAVDPSRRLLWV